MLLPEHKIIEGDIVLVNFHNIGWTLSGRAKVLNVPRATGESWHIKDLETGDIHYISEGCTVTKKTPKSPPGMTG
jgi:hypothetical protein